MLGARKTNARNKHHKTQAVMANLTSQRLGMSISAAAGLLELTRYRARVHIIIWQAACPRWRCGMHMEPGGDLSARWQGSIVGGGWQSVWHNRRDARVVRGRILMNFLHAVHAPPDEARGPNCP